MSTTSFTTTTTEEMFTTTTTTTTTTSTTTTEASTTTTEEPDDEEAPPFEITCENANGKRPMRPHPQDCQKFYTCSYVNGTFVIKLAKCPDGEVFVYEEQNCVIAEKAKPCNVTTTEEQRFREKCERISRPPPAARQSSLNEWTNRPSIVRKEKCSKPGTLAVKDSCNRFVRCIPTSGGQFAKFRYRCPDDFFFFRGKCMTVTALQKQGITCPYFSGPEHDDKHYLPSPVKNTTKVEYPLKRPDYPVIIDVERQDLDYVYDTFPEVPAL